MTQITQSHIDDAIKGKEFHLFRNTGHMVCCVTLNCGFTVVGEAACADPARFELEMGQRYAMEDARRKIGEFLAFEQACKLFQGGQYGH